jgi:hypothetical protein
VSICQGLWPCLSAPLPPSESSGRSRVSDCEIAWQGRTQKPGGRLVAPGPACSPKRQCPHPSSSSSPVRLPSPSTHHASVFSENPIPTITLLVPMACRGHRNAHIACSWDTYPGLPVSGWQWDYLPDTTDSLLSLGKLTRTGRVSQMVERLPSKCEAQVQIPP